MADTEFRVVHVAATLAEADLVRSVLAAYGFTARIASEASAAMLDGFIGLGRAVRIEVPSDEEEAAREALAAAREGGRLAGEEE
jgi:hypothetical protein